MNYTRTKTKATKKEIDDTFIFYNMLSGKSDFNGRRDDMRKIEDMPLTPEQYESLSKNSAKARRI